MACAQQIRNCSLESQEDGVRLGGKGSLVLLTGYIVELFG